MKNETSNNHQTANDGNAMLAAGAVPRNVLLKAVKIIKQWHDMPAQNPDPLMFKIYYEKSPEMKMIRETLGAYDKMKDEVIEATSEAVRQHLPLTRGLSQ